jgi:hypothetical protein
LCDKVLLSDWMGYFSDTEFEIKVVITRLPIHSFVAFFSWESYCNDAGCLQI